MMRILVLGLLPLGLASTAAAQAATAELYGALRYSYDRADDGADTRWTGVNNASRLGVRASVSDSAWTVFGDVQEGVSVDAEAGGAFTPRYAIVGIRSRFGTLTAGRQSPAYKLAGVRVDPFFDTSALRTSGAVPSTGLYAAATFGLSNLTNGFADRTVAYASPALLGVAANAEAHLDPEVDPDYGLGLDYRVHGLDAGVQYYAPGGGSAWSQTAGIGSALRGHASYGREGRWSLGASYERLEADSTDASQRFLYAGGTLNLSPRVVLAASVGHVGDSRAVQPVTGTGYQAGVFFALLPQAQLHALYSRLGVDGGPDRDNVALGIAYQFAIRR